MSIQYSIIIPAKNEEAFIGRCLDSIALVQWDKDKVEVIVVDNGSTDRTVSIAREKGAQVNIKPELTIAGLRNYGAAQATGDVLVFLDADCTVDRCWLTSASVYLNATDGVSAFGSPVVIPDGGTWVQNAWFNVRGKPNLVVDVDWLESANLFVKREAFISVSGFNESLVTCEDYDLTQRLKKTGRLVSDHRVRAIHYREPATVSDFFRKEVWRGKNNLHGLMRHGFSWQEFPSIALPIGYIFIAVLVASCLATVLLHASNFVPRVTVVLFFLWQAPFVIYALRKIRNTITLTLAMQLFLLLNIYFLARGVAMFQWLRR